MIVWNICQVRSIKAAYLITAQVETCVYNVGKCRTVGKKYIICVHRRQTAASLWFNVESVTWRVFESLPVGRVASKRAWRSEGKTSTRSHLYWHTISFKNIWYMSSEMRSFYWWRAKLLSCNLLKFGKHKTGITTLWIQNGIIKLNRIRSLSVAYTLFYLTAWSFLMLCRWLSQQSVFNRLIFRLSVNTRLRKSLK